MQLKMSTPRVSCFDARWQAHGPCRTHLLHLFLHIKGRLGTPGCKNDLSWDALNMVTGILFLAEKFGWLSEKNAMVNEATKCHLDLSCSRRSRLIEPLRTLIWPFNYAISLHTLCMVSNTALIFKIPWKFPRFAEIYHWQVILNLTIYMLKVKFIRWVQTEGSYDRRFGEYSWKWGPTVA